MNRQCRACDETKDISKFAKQKQCKYGREHICLGCKTERDSARRRSNKRKAIDYMGGVCQECDGYFPPAVFDFHHIDPSEKEADPGSLMGRRWDRIVEEIDKCILLCANCHRMEHINEH